MGNVVGISCSIPLDKVFSCTCWRRTYSARESFRSLQKDWDRLRATKNDVQTKIDVEVRQQMTMLESVGQWLQQVETTKTKFEKLETEYLQQSATKCFCATKYFCGYTFGKKVANVQEEVGSLLASKPDQVAQQSLITVAVERPVEPTIGMNSMLDEAWSYMGNDDVGIFALHGMGGVGKTTLMKELNNKLCNSTHSFHVVFWIVISSNPILSKVQNDIGRSLGLHNDAWNDKSQEDKSVNIYNILKQKKFVLFLDDVWQRFDFLKLGVPCPNISNKSKVVLTTRSSQVCGNMKADRTIQVNCLTEEKAWDLFSKTVGENTLKAHPDILEIAKLVAKDCKGLPLALIVIGQTMFTKKTPRAWHISLNQLRNYAAEFTGMDDQILPILKFSYDSLSNPSIRSCFLYCSLYPEDYLISKEEIIEKWICEGFLDKFHDLLYARDMGYEYIDALVNASLLEGSSSEEFKMHDIVREMAIWIGCVCGKVENKFFVRSGVGLTETPNMEELDGSERMSLMRNGIEELNGEPNCPNLVTLFLNSATKLNHIDNEFFQIMAKLRVLDLSDNKDLKEIPEEVCKLLTLQYLNLGSTGITKLPTNLHKLVNLKWFSIGSNKNGIDFPKEVLSSFKKLRVLDLSNNFGVVIPQTFAEEVGSLKHLEDLRMTVANHVVLSRYSSSHKAVSITTLLKVSGITLKDDPELLFSKKMVNLKTLTIQGCHELEYVIPRNGTSKNIYYSNYTSLKILNIYTCPHLENITSLAFAPNLEYIDVSNCVRVKELCGEWEWENELHSPTPFSKLKSLICVHLGEMERILCPSSLVLFPCLKQMRILACTKLKKLPFCSSTSCNSVTITAEEDWWKELEWEDEATRIAFRHSFKQVVNRGIHKHEFV